MVRLAPAGQPEQCPEGRRPPELRTEGRVGYAVGDRQRGALRDDGVRHPQNDTRDTIIRRSRWQHNYAPDVGRNVCGLQNFS